MCEKQRFCIFVSIISPKNSKSICIITNGHVILKKSLFYPSPRRWCLLHDEKDIVRIWKQRHLAPITWTTKRLRHSAEHYLRQRNWSWLLVTVKRHRWRYCTYVFVLQYFQLNFSNTYGFILSEFVNYQSWNNEMSFSVNKTLTLGISIPKEFVTDKLKYYFNIRQY